MRLIRDWEKGEKGVWRWGAREIIYLSVHVAYVVQWQCVKYLPFRPFSPISIPAPPHPLHYLNKKAAVHLFSHTSVLL